MNKTETELLEEILNVLKDINEQLKKDPPYITPELTKKFNNIGENDEN